MSECVVCVCDQLNTGLSEWTVILELGDNMRRLNKLSIIVCHTPHTQRAHTCGKQSNTEEVFLLLLLFLELN